MKKLLIVLLIVLSGCSGPGCTETCRNSGFFDTCPGSFDECDEKFHDLFCDRFEWDEDLKRCKVIDCAFCFSADEEETEEIIEDNKLIIIIRNPETGSERIIEWDLE